MPVPLILAIGLVASILAFRARVEDALATVLAVSLLVPDRLLVPGLPLQYPFSLLTIHRLVLVLFVAGIFVRRIRDGNLPNVGPPWRLTVMLVVFVAVNIVNGLTLNVEAPVQSGAARFLLVADQAVFLAAAVVALRMSRDLRRVVVLVGAAAVAAAIIAVGERITGSSYAAWFFSEVPEQRGRFISGLEQRGGDLRVRGAFPFALSFAWTGVLLLPLLAVAARSARRRVEAGTWIVGAGVLGLAVVFTVSRSVALGAAIAAVLLAVAGRDRRLAAGVAGVGAVAMLFILSSPAVRAPFEQTVETTGSIDIRLERLAEVADVVSDQPWRGAGLGALRLIGVRGLDTSYALTYAELGIIGLTSLVLLVVVAVGTTLGAAVRAPPGPSSWWAAAGMAGAAAGAAGAAAFDLFSSPASYTTYWFMVALAATAAPAPAFAVPRLGAPVVVGRSLVVGLALIAGTILAAAAPTHHTLRFQFETTPPRILVPAANDLAFVGKALARSACEIAEVAGLPDDGRSVRCHVLDGAGGIGEVRVEGPDAGAVFRLAREVGTDLERHLPYGIRVRLMGGIRTGQPTVMLTAPIWLPMLAAAAALLTPQLPVRRMREALVEGLHAPRSTSASAS